MVMPQDIIIRPVLTEKSYANMAEKKYTFEVAGSANKYQIRWAIEALFAGTKVEKVNTLYRRGQLKRMGKFEGYRPTRKFAVVKLAQGSKGIEFFEGMAQD
ncbi:MAG: 50S ribosomal protein L23 [Eubacteriales bacterium]|nr:50S ribosomal protein L23 [Eubacteriales bacterium]